MTAQSLDFLKFTETENQFSMQELFQFISNFDSHHPVFLDWTTHNQAKNLLFQFYILLVKNNQNQQKDIELIVNFIKSIHHTNIHKILEVWSYASSIDPELLEFKQLENSLILHLKNLEESLSKNGSV